MPVLGVPLLDFSPIPPPASILKPPAASADPCMRLILSISARHGSLQQQLSSTSCHLWNFPLLGTPAVACSSISMTFPKDALLPTQCHLDLNLRRTAPGTPDNTLLERVFQTATPASRKYCHAHNASFCRARYIMVQEWQTAGIRWIRTARTGPDDGLVKSVDPTRPPATASYFAPLLRVFTDITARAVSLLFAAFSSSRMEERRV